MSEEEKRLIYVIRNDDKVIKYECVFCYHFQQKPFTKCPNCGATVDRFETLEKYDEILDQTYGNNINHPTHYNMGKYEVIDVIEDWKLDFHLGNAIKYIARASHKEHELEDLMKAVWYINRKIQKINKLKKDD